MSKILIGTPAYDGVLTVACVSSVLQLMESMKKADPNISFKWRQVPGTLVDQARNFLASHVLENRDYTHLLFVDSDMGFSPALVYEKRRQTWRLGKTEIVIDVLPFGLFMEIEGRVSDIKAVERKLGLKGLRTEHATYPQLTAKHGKVYDGLIEARF